MDAKETITVQSFELPQSSYLSEKARQRLIAAAGAPAWAPAKDADIEEVRRGFDTYQAGPNLRNAEARYATQVKELIVDGVRTDVIEPTGGVAPDNEGRVLINLHGGGFRVGRGMGSLVESIPIAATARIKVVSVDYRMAPEYQHPAATEDVAKVYVRLLDRYRPESIGMYGCSAGGALSAMAVVWFAKHQLPRPGALALLSASADASLGGGDSLYLGIASQGGRPPPPKPNPPTVFIPFAYIGSADRNDPLVAPVASDQALAAFPPTLIVTGSRDFEMSAASYTHRRLLAAGALSELIVYDGLGHGFSYDVELPESQECFGHVSRFFQSHLG